MMLQLVVVLMFMLLSSSSSLKPNRFVTKIIYHSSVHSPYYNPNATVEDRIMEDIEISEERLSHLNKPAQYNLSSQEFSTKLIPSGPPRLLLAYLYIGIAHLQQLVVIDTGSRLLWVHCRPCIGCDERSEVPVYDPAESPTYADDDVSCRSSYRRSLRGSCGSLDECLYHYAYIERDSFTEGKLGTEIIATSDGELIPNVVFGCSSFSLFKKRYVSQYNGILGPFPEEISLISQKGYLKFSHCIGSSYDQKYDHSKLIIGEPLVNCSFSTPLIVEDGHYYLSVERISIGNQVLDIDPKILRRDRRWGINGFVVDTGGTFLYLTPVVYESFADEIERLLGVSFRQKSLGKLQVCFVGYLPYLEDFPGVTFQLSGGAKWEFDKDHLFHQFSESTFCLMIQRHDTHNVFGVRLMERFYVAYDLDSMRFSYERFDCEELES